MEVPHPTPALEPLRIPPDLHPNALRFLETGLRLAAAPATHEAPADFCRWFMEHGKAHTTTLAEMGLKRSAQAVAAGYLCVLPSTSGWSSRPGRWVHAAALPEILPRICERASAQEHLQETRERERVERRREATRRAHQRLGLPEETFDAFCNAMSKRPVGHLARKHDQETLALWTATAAKLAHQACMERLRRDYSLTDKEAKAFARLCPNPAQLDPAELAALVETVRQNAARSKEPSPRTHTAKRHRQSFRVSHKRVVQRIKAIDPPAASRICRTHAHNLWSQADPAYLAALDAAGEDGALTFVQQAAQADIDLFTRFEELRPAFVREYGGDAQAFTHVLCKRKVCETLVGRMQQAPAALAEEIHNEVEARRREHCERWARALPETARKARNELLGEQDPALLAAEKAGRFDLAECRLRQRIYGELADRTEDPRQWFPLARLLGRKLQFFAGPTNSGKTHAAIEHLTRAATGVYLAPLRLLAHEVGETLRSKGLVAGIQTGEERDIPDGATHLACTIETLEPEREWEVAVIDEAQMLDDPDRGWAWVHAIVGVPAKTVIIVGAAATGPAVAKLAEMLREPLQVVEFQRLHPLALAERPVPLAELPARSAVVAFSRRAVITIASHLRRKFQRKVAVIYGALSPEVRRKEAQRFRDGEADLLVSTDAIGMGLNLPIERLYFWETDKFDGTDTRPLRYSELLQIAGRAGRYGGTADVGYVGVVAGGKGSLKRIHNALKLGPEPIAPNLRVTLPPGLVGALAQAGQVARLADLPKLRPPQPAAPWRLRGADDYDAIARMWPRQPRSSVETQAWLCCAPASADRDRLMLARAIAALEQGSTVPFAPPPCTNLEAMEEAWRRASLYLWLGLRWPQTFPDGTNAAAFRARMDSAIADELAHADLVIRCSRCSTPLAPGHPFDICDRCYQDGRYRWGGGDDHY